MKLSYDEVYEEIEKYYPIGIPESSPEYYDYPGIIKLRELIRSKMNHEIDKKRWKEFVSSFEWENDEPLGVSHEPSLLSYSYGGTLDLFVEEMSIGKVRRSITFQLSLIGEFYTVYGMDTAEIILTEHLSAYFEPLVYISPYSVYEKWFYLIRDKIEREYQARFVPHSLLKRRVPSLSVPGAEIRIDKNASVYQALFAAADITNYKIFGNRSYD